VNDQYHERISEEDINILQKSFALMVAAPFLSVGFMYCAKQLKKDVSFSENFIYKIREMQDKLFTSNYNRSTERPEA